MPGNYIEQTNAIDQSEMMSNSTACRIFRRDVHFFGAVFIFCAKTKVLLFAARMITR
jgi:hypothetical protein